MNIRNIILGVIVILVIYLLYRYYFDDKKDKVLVRTSDARNAQVLSASSLPSGQTTNYTYSIWLYVNDWNYRFGQAKVVFGRVDENNDPSPSVKLAPSVNNLDITLATYPTSGNNSNQAVIHNCNVNDIPLQKWVNVIISLNDRALDIYLDGKLVRTCILPGVPKVNPSSNIYVCPDGGFSGYISDFRVLAHAVNPTQAYNIYKEGYTTSSALGRMFNKYRLKFAFVKDNKELNSFEI
jgi:hypothetical protein